MIAVNLKGVRKQTMLFSEETGRWCIDINGVPYGFHCGDGFTARINNKKINCRIEMDFDGWYYLIGADQKRHRDLADLVDVQRS